jgi:Fic family protein
LNKSAFWDRFANSRFNDRQRLMINRLLDGFEGKLTSSKWAIIAKCSQDTALRDIEGLIATGVLEKDGGGGRSTAYLLRMI